jgi:outer membrane protein assembly factor BamE (lipoprotein component of BamABCDE complex)
MLLIAGLLVIASCSPIVNNRGHNPEHAEFDKIEVGETDSTQVQELLGSPTTTSNYGDKVWYYISSRKETKGFLAPKIADQNVVAITFDEDDKVKEIDKYDEKDTKKVEIVEKTTPAEGRKLGIVEQLIGNFGKFNAPGRSITPNSHSPGRI